MRPAEPSALLSATEPAPCGAVRARWARLLHPETPKGGPVNDTVIPGVLAMLAIIAAFVYVVRR